MAILTILEGVRDTLRKTNNYDSTNTAIGADTVLNKGMKGGRAAIVFEMSATHGADSESPFGVNRSTHTVLIKVYRRYTKDASYTDLITDVDTIITTLNKYPLLNSTSNALDAEVIETSAVFWLPTEDGAGVAFLGMDLTLEIKESVTASAVE